MTTMTLQVPDALEQEHDETVRLIAAKLYEVGKLSLGQAAEMCGMTKWDFPAVLAQFDVNYIQYTYEDVIADVERVGVVKNQDSAKTKDFTKFVGALTLKEVNDLERAIKDGCGQADADE